MSEALLAHVTNCFERNAKVNAPRTDEVSARGALRSSMGNQPFMTMTVNVLTSGSPPPGGVASMFTSAVPRLRAVIFQVVSPGAPTSPVSGALYIPLLTLIAFFLPDFVAVQE